MGIQRKLLIRLFFLLSTFLSSIIPTLIFFSSSASANSSWSVVPSPNIGTNANVLQSIAAVSSNDVWAVGYYTDTNTHVLIEHWDGTQWSIVPSPTIPGSIYEILKSVTVISSQDIWVVGFIQTTSMNGKQPLIEHWNGARWTFVTSPVFAGTDIDSSLNSISAISANDIWAVGYVGNSLEHFTLIEHWNGSEWQIVSNYNGREVLNSVNAKAQNDVWAVGYGIVAGFASDYYCALIKHWDGIKWSIVIPSDGKCVNNPNLLYGAAAISSDDVWVVGGPSTSPFSEHWDGTSWKAINNPGTGSRLNGIAAVATNDIWAVGADNNGLIEHWDGTQWTVFTNPVATRGQLSSVAAVSSSNVWAVGTVDDSGTMKYKTLIEHYGSFTTPPVACSITTAPSSLNLTVGETALISASVTTGLGSATVTRMRFGSYNSALATVNPSEDTSSPYEATVTAVAAGETAVWATADLSDGRACQSSENTDTDIRIVPPKITFNSIVINQAVDSLRWEIKNSVPSLAVNIDVNNDNVADLVANRPTVVRVNMQTENIPDNKEVSCQLHSLSGHYTPQNASPSFLKNNSMDIIINPIDSLEKTHYMLPAPMLSIRSSQTYFLLMLK